MVTRVLRPWATSFRIAAKLMSKKPSATNEPVVAPLCAVLMQGVSGTSEAQNPFPQPPELGVVLTLQVSRGEYFRGIEEPTHWLLYYLPLKRKKWAELGSALKPTSSVSQTSRKKTTSSIRSGPKGVAAN